MNTTQDQMPHDEVAGRPSPLAALAPPLGWMPPLTQPAMFAILRQADSLPLWLVLRALEARQLHLEGSIAIHRGVVIGGFNGMGELYKLPPRRRPTRPRPQAKAAPAPALSRRAPRARAPRQVARRRTTVATRAGSDDGSGSDPDDDPPSHDLDALPGFASPRSACSSTSPGASPLRGLRDVR